MEMMMSDVCWLSLAIKANKERLTTAKSVFGTDAKHKIYVIR